MQAWKVVLSALFVSSGAAAQTAPPPRNPAGPPPVPTDFLQASNETGSAVKVEFFAGAAPPRDGVRPHASFCVKPKAMAYWPIDARNANGLLRMQVLRGPDCRGPGSDQVSCMSELKRAPRLQHVALRADGKSCAMTPVAAPAMLRGDQPCGPSGVWAPITIHNKTRHGLWVTFLDVEESSIYAAACWLPEEKRMACVIRHRLSLRGEAVNNDPGSNAPARSCSEKIYYDTQGAGQNRSMDLKRNPSFDTTFNCWRTTYGMGCNFD